MRKIPLEFSLYDNVYGGDIPNNQYYVIIFDSLPSKFSTKAMYSRTVINCLEELGFVEECRINTSKRNFERPFESMLVNRKLEIIITIETNYAKDSDLVTMTFLFNIAKGELDDQIDLSEIQKHQKIARKSSIQLVKSDMGHLDTEEYDLVVPDLDLELNYGKKFVKIYETIVKRLNTDGDKGIILFHGDSGTGKTTLLKYITKDIKNKNILFIPPSMAEILSEPSIIPFLMDNRNSILFIEDAEKVIADREGKGSPTGVSNLLNLTDGILGDCLNIQVVATFNMKRERIDPALLRKGRLIIEHKFEKLSIEETNILLKHLNKNVISDEQLTLADIYNIDSDEVRITKDMKKMGFK